MKKMGERFFRLNKSTRVCLSSSSLLAGGMLRTLLMLCLLILPYTVFSQIGTNPANPYGSGNPYGGSQPDVNGNYTNPDGTTTNGQYDQNPTQPNRNKFKPDSAVLKNIFYSWNVKMITEKSIQSDSLTLNPLDTSLYNFQNYSKLYQPGKYYINLGNLGLAAKPLLPDFHSTTGFHNGQTSYDLYLLTPDQISYFRNKSPFTDVFYITGKGQKTSFSEGIFHFIHTRNINPRLNIGIEYTRSGSNGYYARQSADVLNFAAFLWYQSKNLRYNLVSNLIFNSVNADENGGVVSDTLFSHPSSLQHQFEPVNLNGAKTTWNDVGLYLKQYYLIGRIDTVRDPVTKQIKVYPTARAYYSFRVKNSKYNYDDDYAQSTSSFTNTTLGRAFYPNILIDTVVTKDRTTQNEVENEFGLSLFGRGNLQNDKHFSTSGIRLDASIKDDYVNYRQNGRIDSNLNNVILHANAGYDLSNRLSIRADGDYVIIGPNHLDTYLAGNGFLNFGQAIGMLKIRASFQTNSPDLIYNRWISNSYSWNFHFEKMQTKALAASFENERLHFKVSGEYTLIDNYLYFSGIANQVVFPAQFKPEIQFLKLGAEKSFTFFKNWEFEAQAVYQHNSAPFIIRTPDFYGTATLAYHNTYFGVLRVKGGLEGTYYSTAYLYDYAPGLQQFFVYASEKYGNYPIGNIFLLAGLKRVNMVLRYDYFNQGLGKKGYYTVDHYPMPDALFKFGVSWKFYD